MNEELTTQFRAAMPFAELIGVEVDSASPDEVRGRVAWDPGRCTGGGVLHGGLLMGLADSCGGICAFLNLHGDGSTTTTVESKTNFLRGVREGGVTAVTRPLHRGRRFVVLETELRDDRDRLVAKVTQTQAVLAPG